MNFIIGLILIIVTFRLIFWIAGRVLLHYARKQSLFNRSTEQETEQKTQKKTREKIIQKDQGDYVDFEELEKK
jgi:hypothetical protein